MKDRFLNRKEVCERTGLSYSTIRRMEMRGEHPKKYHLSPGRIGWLEREVDEWMNSRTHSSVPGALGNLKSVRK